MGQAKIRREAQAVLGALPKDQIAEAVRAAAGTAHTGICLHQAVVGQRVLRRFGLDTVLIAGDFRRPIGDGYQHTYTREDGRISARAGAFHAWLHSPQTGDIIDFGAWEAPAQMEAEAGVSWPGPRPAFLWEGEAALRRQGYTVMPDAEATALVRRWEAWARGIASDDPEAATFARFGDAAFINACEARAVEMLSFGR